uniref:Uncharacterized protein n=1 Tax=Romanomermis culicivorax TaxID=13658 RepID=A0A915J982_ROMCU
MNASVGHRFAAVVAPTIATTNFVDAQFFGHGIVEPNLTASCSDQQTIFVPSTPYFTHRLFASVASIQTIELYKDCGTVQRYNVSMALGKYD